MNFSSDTVDWAMDIVEGIWLVKNCSSIPQRLSWRACGNHEEFMVTLKNRPVRYLGD